MIFYTTIFWCKFTRITKFSIVAFEITTLLSVAIAGNPISTTGISAVRTKIDFVPDRAILVVFSTIVSFVDLQNPV